MNLLRLAALLALPALISSANAQEWARFRGAGGTAISKATTIPTKISAGDVNWSVDLPGPGHSSPVAWGNRMFLTTCSETKGGLKALCINPSNGNTIWSKDLALNPFRKHKYNSLASATPVLDDKHVYIGYSEPKKYTFIALTHDGKKAWERNLGPFDSQHGSGASPVLYDGKIILNSIKDDDSFIIALNPKNGQTLWQNKRPDNAVAAYGSASVYRPKGGQPQLLFTSQADGIFALNPANGKQLWQVPGLYTKRSACSVTIAGDIAFGSCGSGGGGNYIRAVRAGVPEKGIKPSPAWEIRRSSLSPYVPTPVVHGTYAYLLSDAGFLSCINHQTGEQLYAERLNTDGRRGANFFASPLIIDNRLFCLTTNGKLYICATGPQYKVLSDFQVQGTCHATPAVHGGRLYIRTTDKLYSIGG
ncbi:MAG: PQQ-binding-like beta-propeller repeat protein [Limisphaerales bacterium]